MTNRNTEDIDKLFREGLNPEEGLLTVSEGEWPKLERRLVKHEQKKRAVFWLTRLGGVAALILLFFALRVILTDETGLVVDQPQVQQTDPIQAHVQDPKQADAQQDELEVTGQQNQPDMASQAHKTIRKPGQQSGVPLAQNKQREVVPDNRRPELAEQEQEKADRDTLQRTGLTVPDTTTEPTVSRPEDEPMATVQSPPDSIPADNRQSTAGDDPLLADFEEPVNQSIVEKDMRRMTLSVLAAPDFNGVDNLSNASLGSDFGLLISYAFAKNWSFSTGGIYAKKLYETGYSNYTPAEDIWSEYHPRSVYADCRVLDIPLNVSYTFLRGKNSSFSAGSGISSYIMLKEDYRFNYADPDPAALLTYQVVNGSQHWLSVVNLQATFEQRLSSRLSVSLQPYMKVPLSAVGFAGVKLHTLGMAANLNWNFNL